MSSDSPGPPPAGPPPHAGHQVSAEDVNRVLKALGTLLPFVPARYRLSAAAVLVVFAATAGIFFGAGVTNLTLDDSSNSSDISCVPVASTPTSSATLSPSPVATQP